MAGHMTRQILDGFALELLKLLDQAIHEKNGYYDEPMRKYVRRMRDPFTSTVLAACRNAGMQLEMGWFLEGRHYAIRTDEDVRRFVLLLRGRIAQKAPTSKERQTLLYDLDLTETKLSQWTRTDCSSPRFGDLVRLANHLDAYTHFYDIDRKQKIEFF